MIIHESYYSESIGSYSPYLDLHGQNYFQVTEFAK